MRLVIVREKEIFARNGQRKRKTDNSQQRHETMAHLGCLIYPCAYTVDGNLQHTVGNNPLID